MRARRRPHAPPLFTCRGRLMFVSTRTRRRHPGCTTAAPATLEPGDIAAHQYRGNGSHPRRSISRATPPTPTAVQGGVLTPRITHPPPVYAPAAPPRPHARPPSGPRAPPFFTCRGRLLLVSTRTRRRHPGCTTAAPATREPGDIATHQYRGDGSHPRRSISRATPPTSTAVQGES